MQNEEWKELAQLFGRAFFIRSCHSEHCHSERSEESALLEIRMIIARSECPQARSRPRKNLPGFPSYKTIMTIAEGVALGMAPIRRFKGNDKNVSLAVPRLAESDSLTNYRAG